jgi:hypothetical protein
MLSLGLEKAHRVRVGVGGFSLTTTMPKVLGGDTFAMIPYVHNLFSRLLLKSEMENDQTKFLC